MPIPKGTIINNRYKIITSPVSGGMGEVYIAEDTHFKQKKYHFAIKFINADKF